MKTSKFAIALIALLASNAHAASISITEKAAHCAGTFLGSAAYFEVLPSTPDMERTKEYLYVKGAELIELAQSTRAENRSTEEQVNQWMNVSAKIAQTPRNTEVRKINIKECQAIFYSK